MYFHIYLFHAKLEDISQHSTTLFVLLRKSVVSSRSSAFGAFCIQILRKNQILVFKILTIRVNFDRGMS